MKQSLFINSDEMITLWLLSMLHTAILAEGLTEEYRADLRRLGQIYARCSVADGQLTEITTTKTAANVAVFRFHCVSTSFP